MRLLLCVLLLSLIAIPPVLGFSADRLEIEVQEEGGARIDFDYSLSWIERFAVFLRIADPAGEFTRAVEEMTGAPVTLEKVNMDTAVFCVDQFASVRNENSTRVYATPSLHFPAAEVMLQQYWFAPLVQADFSPATTLIRFPDGTTEIWTDAEDIPSVTHRESRFITAEIVC